MFYIIFMNFLFALSFPFSKDAVMYTDALFLTCLRELLGGLFWVIYYIIYCIYCIEGRGERSEG